MKEQIQLAKAIKKGVVLEEASDFRESTFSSVYQKVGVILKKMIQSQLQSLENHEKQMKLEESNLISFEGRRGTGKTSVMLSVCNALKHYQNPLYDTDFLIWDKKYENVSFTVLDYIDASLLESGEDILELVLANMYSQFTAYAENGDCFQNNEDYLQREIYQAFDEVYGDFLNIKRKEKRGDSISPLRLLTKVSGSQALGKKLQNLIHLYLKYMGHTRNHFLIITIDDLDMFLDEKNGETPFNILEKIHRYLMIPGVIILLTYNYQDLCRGCDKHFKMFLTDEKDILKKKVRDQTIQYLRKVIPIWARVHMLSLSKKDYTSEGDPQVEFTYEQAKKCFPQLLKYLWNDEIEKNKKATISLKRFSFLIQAEMVEDASLFYDALGNKRHFIEISTLRELSQRYEFKEHIHALREQENTENKNQIEKRIFKELLDDLYFRVAMEKLTPESFDLFENYLSVNIERRSHDIIKDIRKKHGNISEIVYSGSNPVSSYSYGELLFYLYRASSEGWMEKSLIWCILNSYTIMLTKIKWKITQGNTLTTYKNTGELSNSMILFQKIMGASVASSWSNRLLPRVKFRFTNTETDSVENQTIPQSSASQSAVGAIKIAGMKMEWDYVLSEEYNPEIIKKEFQTLEILGMFFTKVSVKTYDAVEHLVDSEGFSIKYDGQTLKDQLERLDDNKIALPDEKREKGILLHLIFTDACFNIMNFVNNSYDYKNYFHKLHKSLETEYSQYLTQLGDFRYEQFLQENSLEKEFEEWFDKSNGFAMPVYSFDIMYNILKRVALNNVDTMISTAPDRIFDYLKSVYKNIGRMLEKEGEFYFSNLNGNAKENILKDNYFECPFIKFVLQQKQRTNPKEEDRFKDKINFVFADHFEKMIRVIGQY